ncbi:MAG: autotransporter outer membrane beta-barrel domain-containing protein, partial [Burkholderiaceae bacterium]
GKQFVLPNGRAVSTSIAKGGMQYLQGGTSQDSVVAGQMALIRSSAASDVTVLDGGSLSIDRSSMASRVMAMPGATVALNGGELANADFMAGSALFIELYDSRFTGTNRIATVQLFPVPLPPFIQPQIIKNEGRLVFEQNADYALAAPLVGNGILVQNGSAILTLADEVQQSAVLVQAGQLDITGTTRAAVTVNHGARLGGSGTLIGNLDLAGFVRPGTALDPAATLTVRGNWTSTGGTLEFHGAQAGVAAPLGLLVIDAGQVTGTTQVRISNVAALGKKTEGDGIALIHGIHGANTTAQNTRQGFVLQGPPLDVGAYEYRLYPGDAAGQGENWYLRSSAPPPPPPPSPPPPPPP